MKNSNNEGQELAGVTTESPSPALEQDVLDAAECYFAAKCALVAAVAISKVDEDALESAAHDLLDAEMVLCDAVGQWNADRARASTGTTLPDEVESSVPHQRKS